MRHEIVLAPQAAGDLKRLGARDRATIRSHIEAHLRHEPEKVSRSRIKRLREMNRPQYRLRVDEFRVFYDVAQNTVEVLAIVKKSTAADWLQRKGEPSS